MRHTPAERQFFVAAAAERMRTWQTPAERRLWTVLEPLGFARQVPLELTGKNGGRWNVIMDFFNPKANLCIEVDGGIHKKTKGPDGRRDRRLAFNGVRTLRFDNWQVFEKLDGVRAAIERALDFPAANYIDKLNGGE